MLNLPKKLLITLIAISSLISVAAQQKSTETILPQLTRERPDMEQIKKEISDPRSHYYYPRLMAEYLRNDTLMKLDKFRRLYLGAMFQEDYLPYRSADHPVPLTVMTETQKADADSIRAYAERSLADDPFDLRQMMLLVNALRAKGQTNLAKIWQYKLNYLLMTIVSTGTGRDEENAWVVIDPQHEHVLLNMMGYIVNDARFLAPFYEYLTVSDGQGRKRGGYYFNIQTMLEEYYRKNPEELQGDYQQIEYDAGDEDYDYEPADAQ